METTKTAMIAAVSAALKYKRENPHVTEESIIRHIVDQCSNIIKEIEDFGE